MECGPEVAITNVYDTQSWEGLTLGLHDICASDDVPDQQHNGISSQDWLQQSFGLNDAYMMDGGLLGPMSWSPPPPPPAFPSPSQQQSQPTSNGTKSTSSVAAGQRLLALITDMQQRVKMLEEGPWQNNSTRSLDDYPVGTVLHLSQEFSTIAGLVLGRANAAEAMLTPSSSTSPSRERVLEGTAVGGETQPTKHNDDTEGLLGDLRESGVDTATTLLVLSGYMWLVHIYSIVLSHFQRHLSCISSSTNSPIIGHDGMASNVSISSTLQLGELSCTSTAPDLGRIHTAVGMLLTALHDVEKQLGQGGAVARNLIMSRLTQESVVRDDELQNDCGRLGGKVISVKKLLGEKMGF